MSDFLENLAASAVIGDPDIRFAFKDPNNDPERAVLNEVNRLEKHYAACAAAGVQLVRTPTLRANRILLEPLDLMGKVAEINWGAAQTAKSAVPPGCSVAGVVGPLPDLGRTAVKGQLQLSMGALLDGQVDVILLSEFEDPEQLTDAIEVKHGLHHCSTLCLFAQESDTPWGDLALSAAEAGAEVIILRCSTEAAPDPFVEDLLEEGLDFGVELYRISDSSPTITQAWQEWNSFGAQLLLATRNTTLKDLPLRRKE